MGNVLEPLANAMISYGRWVYGCWKSYNFNFNEFFKTVELKNKKNMYPKLIKEYSGKLGMIYLFNIPTGLSVNDFKKYKEALETQLKEKIDIRDNKGFIEIEVITTKLSDNIQYKLPNRMKDSIYIPIGESLDGTEGLDLKENPHSYIVGTTGSGKSVCTKGILTSIVNNYNPNEIELLLCDLKMVELALFRNLKHTKKFVYTVEDTTEVIADLLEETKNRYNLFMDAGVTSIFQYNKLPNIKKLKYQILFIEEAVILLEDKSKRAMKLLKQLMAISRASGCYIFVTTQRPSTDIIDNVVKSLISNRIVFKVEDTKNSTICLDQEGAEKLKGRGHGILKIGSEKTEFQSYFISDKQVKEYTKKYIIDKRNKPMREPQTNLKIDKDELVDKEEIKSIEDLSFLDNLN